MPKRSLLWIINLIMLILSAGLAFQGWQRYQRTSILVEWTTASELDTVGYNLYRSLDPQEIGTRVNQELIPSSSDPLTGGAYTFEDQDVQAGKKYYYSLEEVENSGNTNRAGTIEVVARRTGWWEIGLAALVFGGVIVGIFSLMKDNRKPEGSN